MARKLTTDITGCARCGGRHKKVKLKRFTNPVLVDIGGVDDNTGHAIDPVMFTHYAECPKMGQPILVFVDVEHGVDEETN